MQNQETTILENQKKAENPKSHRMKMILGMAICCAIPISAVTVISAFGLAASSLNTLAVLACPLGMGAMMFFMMRSNRGDAEGKPIAHACCPPMSTKNEPVEDVHESVQVTKTSTVSHS